MAKGKIFDETILVEFANRLHEAESKKAKGEAIQWFIDMTGVSKGTVYRIIEKMFRKEPLSKIAAAKQTRRSRKTDIQLAQEKRDILTLAAIKFQNGPDKRPLPTERAQIIWNSMGYGKKEKYSRSTVDRKLAQYRTNAKHMNNRPVAHRLKADYPFHVVGVDATPLDLYYLTLDANIKRYDTPKGDKHLDDILQREQLRKIWLYCLVDMYSDAFLIMPFASLPKGINSKKSGENADDWYSFLKFGFLPKNNLISPLDNFPLPLLDCPIEGQPTILFCDKGSGIGGSKLITNLCGNLGIEIVIHVPGNPSAKGFVEGRISAFKRSYESMLNRNLIKNINQLIYFCFSWSHKHNKKSGAYDKWREGVQDKPIIRLTDQSFKNASVTRVERVIDAYGCISIDNKYFFVTEDESWRGQRVQVYRPYVREGGLRYSVLLDKKIVSCIEGKSEHGFKDIKSFPKSEGAKNREEVNILAGQVRSKQIFEDILPELDDGKVRHLPNKFTTKEVHTPLVRDKFMSVNNAIDWMLNQNGLFLEEIPQDYINKIKSIFEMLLYETGSIDGDTVVTFSNSLAKYKTTLIEQKGDS
ncbi:MAG: hypothetical protein FWH53_00680 [Leptospirales bacterium]|nr:hypothetical protein [Leptospirales bacterium]